MGINFSLWVDAAGEAYVPSTLLLAACDVCSVCIQHAVDVCICGAIPVLCLQPVAPVTEPGLPQMTQDMDLCSRARKVADPLHAVYPLCC